MKNILITGVSNGLGFETAKLLLEQGNSLYGISRSKNNNTEELSIKYPGKFQLVKFDLGELNEIKKMWMDNFQSFNIPIHAFIDNAAIAYDDLITNMKLNKLENMFRINVFSPLLLIKLVIRNMILNKIRGNIVHISSISVHTGYKGLAMYASTKGALEAFSKNTAREWGEKGIRSNCIIAGFMETNMSASLDGEMKNRIYKRTSLKTPIDMKSVAGTVSFLISDGADMITGQNIFVDAGTI